MNRSENVKLPLNHTQVCVIHGLELESPSEVEMFEEHLMTEFGVEAKFLENVLTYPDKDGAGNIVPDTGMRPDLFFSIKDGYPDSFPIKRFSKGIRWLEDVIDNQDMRNQFLYPERIRHYMVSDTEVVDVVVNLESNTGGFMHGIEFVKDYIDEALDQLEEDEINEH
jgi:hypothetical protein